MSKFYQKIPVLRSIVRNYTKLQFDRKWRKLNPHNITVAGERMFPLRVVSVGKDTYGMLNIYSYFADSSPRLEIGNYVSIASGVSFMLDINHQIQTFTTFPLQTRLFKPSPKDAVSKGPLIIEDEVWLGANSMILSGLTIGKGAIVAAGAIVTRDVPPYAIVGGNPARIIRYRFSEEVIKELLPIKLIDLQEEWLRENIELLYRKIETVDDVLKIKKLIASNTSKK
jgi:virginiamycin A acetyltransferase